MQTQTNTPLSANADTMRQHLEFLFSDMREYDDGRIEISILNFSDTFLLSETDKAINKALLWNGQGKNVYVVGSVLNPDMCPSARSCDEDFYATSVVWCDIDDPIDKEELKKLYAHCPPSAAVITAHVPNRRLQLWWKLTEPLTDADTLREALQGVQEALRGDPKVKNVTSLMRLGGGVNLPTEVKRAKGRITEATEYHSIHNNKVSIEAFINAYPIKEYFDPVTSAPQAKTTIVSSGGLSTQIIDGREQYMSDMVYAAIINLTGSLGRWPTAQEVYNDAWPVYSSKVGSRGQRTLDQDHRGAKAMQQKILSKLRLITTGRVRSAPTLEIILRNAPKKQATETIDPSTGEVKQKPKLFYTKAKDIKRSLDANDFVQGLLSDNQLSVVYGESNCGKTFFMTDLSFHIALGRKWRDKRVEKGGVIYAALEGSYGLKNRVAAFQEHYKYDADMPFAMVASQIDFLNPEGNIDEFINLIKAASDDLGSVRMVVVDTLARALSGGDENSSQDMGMLVNHADKIRHATGAHVSFIHHSGKDKARGARGHSSLRAACDTEIEVSKETDAEYSTVKTVKQREMEMGEDMNFRLEVVNLGANKYGDKINSCVVLPVEIDPIESPVRNLQPKTKLAFDVFNNCMIESGQQVYGDNFPARAKVITEAQFRDRLLKSGLISDDSKLQSAQFFRIKKSLIENNVIREYDKRMWVC